MVSSVGMSSFMPPMMRHPPPSFDKLDANGDGSISLDELESTRKNMPAGKSGSADRAQAFLKKLDTNGDGSISKDEFAAFQSNMASQVQAMMLKYQEQANASPQAESANAQDMFAKIDANGDGSIAPDELSTFLSANDPAASGDKTAQLFNSIDTNGDGKIDKSEIDAFLAKAHGHHRGHGGDKDGDQDSADGVSQSFDVLDTNHDGVVSADELAAGTSGTSSPSSDVLTKLMNAIDQNGDGGISKDEAKSFMDLVTQTFGSRSGTNANAQAAANCYSSAASLLDPASDTQSAEAA